jgi:hypothetical protein
MRACSRVETMSSGVPGHEYQTRVQHSGTRPPNIFPRGSAAATQQCQVCCTCRLHARMHTRRSHYDTCTAHSCREEYSTQHGPLTHDLLGAQRLQHTRRSHYDTCTAHSCREEYSTQHGPLTHDLLGAQRLQPELARAARRPPNVFGAIIRVRRSCAAPSCEHSFANFSGATSRGAPLLRGAIIRGIISICRGTRQALAQRRCMQPPRVTAGRARHATPALCP